jgi:uncharacterized integral membrane protein
MRFFAAFTRLTLRLIVLVLVALMLWIVAANRHNVLLSFDPFSLEAPAVAAQAPLFVWLLGALLLGALIGAFTMWIDLKGDIRTLKRQNKALGKAANGMMIDPAAGATELLRPREQEGPAAPPPF